MHCYRCHTYFAESFDQSWDNACPRCGCLAWLHRGMDVSVQVVDVQRLESGAFGANVRLGADVRGMAEVAETVRGGDMVQCRVVQIDFEDRRVWLQQLHLERRLLG